MLFLEVLEVAKNKQNKKQGRAAAADHRTGFGDKKLQGPNKPAD
jgi:hypothetical protein